MAAWRLAVALALALFIHTTNWRKLKHSLAWVLIKEVFNISPPVDPMWALHRLYAVFAS